MGAVRAARGVGGVSRMRLPALLALVFASGCGAIECCMDGSVQGVVAGVVVDGSQSPVAGVDLQGIEFQRGCDGWISGFLSEARTDQEGRFVMEVYLPLMQEGQYCFTLVLAQGVLSDTVRGLEMWARTDGRTADTARVTLVALW